MRQFVVACYDFFEGEIKMKAIQADDEANAILKYLELDNLEEEESMAHYTVKDWEEYLEECDCSIAVYEWKNP